MKHKKNRSGFLLACVLIALYPVLIRLSHAEAPPFDMYSWQKENANDWCFALLPSSEKLADAATAKSAKNQVCGRHDVKGLMGGLLTAGSKVSWKTNEAQGLILPPAQIVNDLVRFSTTMDYKLIPPEGQYHKGDGFN